MGHCRFQLGAKRRARRSSLSFAHLAATFRTSKKRRPSRNTLFLSPSVYLPPSGWKKKEEKREGFPGVRSESGRYASRTKRSQTFEKGRTTSLRIDLSPLPSSLARSLSLSLLFPPSRIRDIKEDTGSLYARARNRFRLPFIEILYLSAKNALIDAM